MSRLLLYSNEHFGDNHFYSHYKWYQDDHLLAGMVVAGYKETKTPFLTKDGVFYDR